MLAPRPIEPDAAAPATETASPPEVRAPVRTASDRDAAAASPVHDLQARLLRRGPLVTRWRRGKGRDRVQRASRLAKLHDEPR